MHAIIPAAGHSTRMGRPKLSLPLGDRTVLQRVIDALREAGVEVLVVLGPHVADLRTDASLAGATVMELPAPTTHMRATVEAGLDLLEKTVRPPDEEPWLLVPADHPVVDAALIRSMIASFEIQPRYSIMVPIYRAKRGHPTLIRWKHAAGIRAFPADVGLNAYLRQFPGETLEFRVSTPDVLLDLDTPEEYERLRKRFE